MSYEAAVDHNSDGPLSTQATAVVRVRISGRYGDIQNNSDWRRDPH